MNDLRNLLVAATNKLIEEGHVRLDHEPITAGHIITELFGKNTAIIWSDAGFEELRISVWWDYNHDAHPQTKRNIPSQESFRSSKPLAKPARYSSFVGVLVSGWFERKLGFYLQGKGRDHLFDTYVRQNAKPMIADLPRVEPKGFKAEGKFHM